MVDAMEAVQPADSAPRRRPSPRQSLRPRRDGHGLVRQGRLAPAVRHGRPGSSRRNDLPTGPAVTFRRMRGGSSVVAGTAHGHHLLASHLSTAVSLPR